MLRERYEFNILIPGIKTENQDVRNQNKYLVISKRQFRYNLEPEGKFMNRCLHAITL